MIQRLASAIAHRGGDGSGEWRDTNAAMVHTALHTTAHATIERQPFTSAHALVVVADARIDNRAELLTELRGVSADDGDAAFIAAAYEAWGEQCVKKLDGDFSFALWDGSRRTLFCARDASGVKPLVYCFVPGKLFAFASEVQALLRLDEVPKTLDEKRIAEFILVRFDNDEATFHREIKRLPGGCSLRFDRQPRITRYWEPGDGSAPVRGSDEELAEGFFAHFSRAMLNRMNVRSTGELGVMLSGGLDSSPIAAFARDELRRNGEGSLPALSWIFSDVPDADERHYQEVVAATGGIERHVLDSANAGLTPWSDLELLLPNGPPYAPNFYLNRGAAELLRSLGVRVILDGLGGDGTISRGGAHLVELFRRGKILALKRELLAIRRIHGDSIRGLLLQRVLRPMVPIPILGVLRRLRRKRSLPSDRLLAPRVAELVRAAAPEARAPLSARAEHIAHLRSPLLGEGLELFDRVMALSGVEGRYPFFDRRLIEYCISLPADQKLSNGYSRIVARRAYAGLLPDEIRWRPDKGKPGLHIAKALRDQPEVLRETLFRDEVLASYVELSELKALYERFLRDEAAFVEVIRLWSAAALARWLRRDG